MPPNESRLLWVNNPRTSRVSDISKLPELAGSKVQYEETHELLCTLLPKYKDAKVTEYHYCKYVNHIRIPDR